MMIEILDLRKFDNKCISISSSLIDCLDTLAKKMKFNLEDLKFEVSGSYDPTAFLKEMDNPPPTHFHTIHMTVLVKTSESLDRLKELRDKTEKLCPVSSLIHAAKTEVISEWKKME